MRGPAHERRPFVVVLTGGIAAGKSAVSQRFAALGVPVIDTDVIARQLVEPGQPALAAIVRTFGGDVLDGDGRLDRRRMRDLVFADPGRRQQLEAILHPAIGADVQRQVLALDAAYCILVIPLLAESGRYQWADRVLVVDVDEQTQIARVMARDRIGRGQAEAILAAQAGRQQRLALADDVIDNRGSPQQLDLAVAALHDRYRHLASSSRQQRGHSNSGP
jgi:dephospho-CoA kinase